MRAITAALAGIAALAAIGIHGAGAEATKPRHAIAMHGEPKYGPDFKHFDYVNPEAPKGGTIRLAERGTFDSFNPFIPKGNAAAGLGGLYETLLTNSDDEAFTEYGQLAESIEMPEDRSWVAFTLRKEARWHDGKPVTPEDVIFSLEILKTKGRPFFRYYFADVKKAEKTGPHTVRFTFSGGENRELPLIVGQCCPGTSGKGASSTRPSWSRRSETVPTGSSPSSPAARSPTSGSRTTGRRIYP